MKEKYGLLLLMMLGLVSCKFASVDGTLSHKLSGEQTVERRQLSGFEQIEVIGSPTVYYQQADTTSVSVCGPKELVSDIITEVSSGVLTIRNRGKLGVVNFRFSNDDELYITVTSPDIVGVVVTGSGDFISEGHVDTDQMNLRLKGSGDVRFSDIICDRCDIEVVGSGDVKIERLDTRSTSATLVGSGDINIRQQHVKTTDLSVRGSGDIDLTFGEGCEAVNAELRGSGDIRLKGAVRQIRQSKHGSGDIDTDDLSHP